MLSSSDNCTPYISDPDTPDCIPLCAPSSFYCSTKPLDRRSESWGRPSPFLNNSQLAGPPIITKRSIQSNPLTQDQLPTYLPDQFGASGFDTYFGQPLPTVRDPEDDATVFQLQSFGNNAFAIGARYVHGCSMLTIVSSTSVWMVRCSSKKTKSPTCPNVPCY